MSLSEYRRKRDFSRTPEPDEKEPQTSGDTLQFVVQKHDATRLHYDFRLELNGVLLSWAVPKGPSLDTADKRMAVHVEDHPLDYGGFEGAIPKGEYGGGTVLVWDRGSWAPEGDPHAAYAAGMLKFHLYGQKLKGKWALIRTKQDKDATQEQWLLIKERDEYVRPRKEYDILAARPESVLSGLKIEEVAESSTRVWSAAHGEISKPHPIDASGIKGARKADLPATLSPQLATLAESPPESDEWVHEIKYDGYRIMTLLNGGRCRLITRNGLDWTTKFTSIARAIEALPATKAIIDGEIAVLDEQGVTSFDRLLAAISGEAATMLYYAFDLLYLDGWDLTEARLIDRKESLAALLKDQQDIIRYSDHVTGTGRAFYAQACKFHLEGVISKRASRPYRGGRGPDWIKVKCKRSQEFVIGGFTDPQGSRDEFGALLVGYFEEGKFVYAGRVGTGFNRRTLQTVSARLRERATDFSPFADSSAIADKNVHWTEPTVVVDVEFIGWTRAGVIRHASFRGIREDKEPSQVGRERPAVIEAPPAPPPKSVPEKKPRNPVISGVTITNPDRILYPDERITKLELARYIEFVAPRMLPYVSGRLLMLVRCPEGYDKDCFYQKHPSLGMPERIRQVLVEEKDGTEHNLMVDSVQGLVSLVQMGALEVHTWGSLADRLDNPDRLVFDLDPDPSVGFADVVDAAFVVRDRLQSRGLTSFAKTTGGKGIHVVVPISGDADWDRAKAFARLVAEGLEREFPKRFVANSRKAARSGRIYVDFLRNGRGATAIAAYSARARAGAPISLPVTWDELPLIISGGAYTIRGAERILTARFTDPWVGFGEVRQNLPQ